MYQNRKQQIPKGWETHYYFMSRRCFCQRTACSSHIPPHQQALISSMAALQAWVTYVLLPPEWEPHESAESGQCFPPVSGFALWTSATLVGHGLFAWFFDRYSCSTLSSLPDLRELYLLWPLASGSLSAHLLFSQLLSWHWAFWWDLLSRAQVLCQLFLNHALNYYTLLPLILKLSL